MTPAVNTMAGRRTLWQRRLLIGLVAGMLLCAGATGVPAAEPHRDVTGTTTITTISVIMKGIGVSSAISRTHRGHSICREKR